ncbi:MAG: hypothetical protein M1827_002011 [Pycnora praestabilis]|nr:MAG: hypothetical protein M1827_002011 [Pycnora praestabilis]
MAEQELPPLLALPAELLHDILSHLSSISLAALSQTCHLLQVHAAHDQLWQRLVQAELPADRIQSPTPCPSFRDLYISYHPYWFLPRQKIWFSDSPHTGKLIVARYDSRRGCIEAYRLVAERGSHTFEVWEWNPEVIVHTFNPKVRLWLDEPMVRLDRRISQHGLQQEVRMVLGREDQGIFSMFSLARPIPNTPQALSPSMAVWPPHILPAKQRVRNQSQEAFRGNGHKPQKLSEVSDSTFRIRKWMEFTNLGQPVGIRMGEDVTTFSTIPEEAYTPTKEKPWRGIWVGDYAGHGCEFLILLQPDDRQDLLPSRSRASSNSSCSSYASAQMDVSNGDNGTEQPIEEEDEAPYKGRLEAVKLTGDPNIPRGEYTFIAEDIGQAGLIRVAEEELFKGARIVKAKGHVADRGFRNDHYIPSQLIMISHDKLAQYWEAYGHLSFYNRVKIDQFLKVD